MQITLDICVWAGSVLLCFRYTIPGATLCDKIVGFISKGCTQRCKVEVSVFSQIPDVCAKKVRRLPHAPTVSIAHLNPSATKTSPVDSNTIHPVQPPSALASISKLPSINKRDTRVHACSMMYATSAGQRHKVLLEMPHYEALRSWNRKCRSASSLERIQRSAILYRGSRVFTSFTALIRNRRACQRRNHASDQAEVRTEFASQRKQRQLCPRLHRSLVHCYICILFDTVQPIHRADAHCRAPCSWCLDNNDNRF